MIKSVEVLNKTQAEEFALQKHDKQYIIISIASRKNNKAFIKHNEYNNIKDILFISFNDTDSSIVAYGGITVNEATKIVKFINKYIHTEADINLIVHCEAGQSRSAGVAAAIMKYLYNNDTDIFNNRYYKPNMLCYRKVLNAFMECE